MLISVFRYLSCRKGSTETSLFLGIISTENMRIKTKRIWINFFHSFSILIPASHSAFSVYENSMLRRSAGPSKTSKIHIVIRPSS